MYLFEIFPRHLSLSLSANRHKRTSLWVVLGDVRLGQVVNDLLLQNFGVIDEEFGTLIQQVFSNVDTRRLPGVARKDTFFSQLSLVP